MQKSEDLRDRRSGVLKEKPQTMQLVDIQLESLFQQLGLVQQKVVMNMFENQDSLNGSFVFPAQEQQSFSQVLSHESEKIEELELLLK
jgi:hypothetical protein